MHGRQMILQNCQQAWQQGVITRLKSLSAFVEGPDVYASEGVLTRVDALRRLPPPTRL